jgi:hypothetical protein
MRLPALQGLIRRRLLINFRADPRVVEKILPAPFSPKLYEGWSLVGICLIRLERIRPAGWPVFLGLSSENAAHRIAVTWSEASGQKEGVFIPRRDTSVLWNHLAGGRLFPGEHHYSKFQVSEEAGGISVSVRAKREPMSIDVRGKQTDSFPSYSVFSDLGSSSRFFSAGSIGYSVTSDCCRFDGIRLETEHWKVGALEIQHVESTFFSDPKWFPHGSVEFDHALIMRDIPHRWLQEPDIVRSAQTDGLGHPLGQAESPSDASDTQPINPL